METSIAGIRLEHPIMNGAGWACKTIEEVQALARAPVSAIVVGSITMEPRLGNPGNVFWQDPAGVYSLNSLGLPNPGCPYYGENLQQMRRTTHNAQKPLIVSIACFSPEEYAELAGFVAAEDVDMVELNLGCPNVWGPGGQKPIASYEPKLMEKILQLAKEELRQYPLVRVAVKISPLPPAILNEVASVIAESGFVDAITATNTIPNGFAWGERWKPAIDPGDGLAGIAGPALKPVSMGVIKQLCQLLPDTIDIIAAGGVRSGSDVADYLNISPKVKAVQVVTAHANEGTGVFGRILMELAGLREAAASLSP